MWKLAAEEADEGLTSVLLASHDKEASLDQLIGPVTESWIGDRKVPKVQSERVGRIVEIIDQQLALIFYAKTNCPEALFRVSGVDNNYRCCNLTVKYFLSKEKLIDNHTDITIVSLCFFASLCDWFQEYLLCR